MVKRSIFSTLCLVVVFICLISMMCPAQTMARFVPSGQPLAEYSAKSLVSTSGALISADGTVTVTGSNPNIYLDGINQNIQTVAIKFKEPVSKSFAGVMYYDTGEGLNESQKSYSAAFAGDEWVCFVIPDSECKAVRIDINLDYKLESVNVYQTVPDTIETGIENPWWEYVVCSVISLLVFVGAFLLDGKYGYVDKLCKYFRKNLKYILIGLIGFLSALLLSIGIEMICGLLFGATSTGKTFNIFRYFFICGIILCIEVIFFFARSIAKQPEKLFLSFLLIFGFLMIFTSPFGHISWDVETHYSWALDASYIGDAYKTEADHYIISNQDLYWSKENLSDNEKNIEFANNAHGAVVEEFRYSKRITHLPSGIFIALARFFGLNYYWVYTLGKVPNLLIYAFACYFGMKKLKSGKMILAVVALLPTNLFLATNYSYDFWVTSLSILGISYFVSEMQQPEKQISLKDNIIMCGSLALACIPKQIYAPLLLIPFFLKKNDFKNRKRYYTVCVSAFAVLLLLLAIRSLSSVTSAGDLRGGSAVNPMQQVEFILGQPLTYAKILIKFLWNYLSFGATKEYICNFAYLGYGYGHYTMLSLMIITAFTDKNEYDMNNKYLLVKGFNLLLFLGMAVLVATALYVSFTAVGSSVISGCQGRYLTPVLLPVLSVIGSKMINNKMNRAAYNYLIMIPCAIVVLMSIASTMISRLL